MTLLAVLGVILIVVGILGLLHVIGLSLTVSIIIIVVGLVLAFWFGRSYYTRAP
jgi:arginine exporter protein ArgO